MNDLPSKKEKCILTYKMYSEIKLNVYMAA